MISKEKLYSLMLAEWVYFDVGQNVIDRASKKTVKILGYPDFKVTKQDGVVITYSVSEVNESGSCWIAQSYTQTQENLSYD